MASQELCRSAATYIIGAAQISLELLQSLSSLVPVPYMTAVVAVACKLIQIAQTVQDNVKGVDLLIERVKAVVLVVLTSLKGKAVHDIPNDLMQSITHFSNDLLAIDRDVRRVKNRTDTSSFRSLIKAIIGYGDNVGLIAECTSRLEWAMRHFDVESHIQDSIRIAQVLKEVKGVSDGIRDLQRDVGTILENMDLATRIPIPSAAIPPKPALFYGREIEIEDITRRVVSAYPSRFGITGSGGIGKTSLVLAVLGHPAIIRHFNSLIHWSRCDDATSPPLLIEVIARSFRLDQPSNDRLQDIKSFLHSNTSRRLLILDNFETPWDIEGRQSEVTDILCALTAFPHLAILVTMRGTLPGVGRIKWSKPELPPLAVLPVKAARELYVEIDPKADSDEALEALLAELDHMPLAVTLMAKVGSEGGETPKELLKRWRLRGTEVIHEEGGDRLTSVNLSIQVSLRSNIMVKNPDALRVLSVLAVLPGGIRNDIIQELVPDVPDPARARWVLLRTSLVYTRTETSSFHVLSPIRSYVAHHHPPVPELWRGLHRFCFTYIEQHNLTTWDCAATARAIAVEAVNLEAILSHALRHDPSEAAITAALRLTNYQRMTDATSGPQIAILAVAAAKRVGTERQVADCLETLGLFTPPRAAWGCDGCLRRSTESV
ncbi:hypothetical protein FRB94_012088 [Tulasnella sp. JGI-2019a]|nr:hypothetical protein FRB93_010226 [Tulasnella sp. JGI-2019a]KAG8992011.1 hypothetical protein FRB94_012088 [Tulasnella sp. JGI-2019a]